MSTTYTRKRGDTAQPFRYSATYSDGTTPNFLGATVKMIMSLRGGTTPKVSAAGTISGTTFSYQPIATDVDTVGTYQLEWQITYSGGAIETWPGAGYLIVNIIADLG